MIIGKFWAISFSPHYEDTAQHYHFKPLVAVSVVEFSCVEMTHLKTQ